MRLLGAMTAVLLAGTAALASPAAASGRPDLVVRTDAGSVRGAVSYGVEGFLGIPYAAPPTGKLRWQPPRPVQRWKGVRPAAEFGSQCAQPAGLDSEFGSTAEDCLFVNVQRRRGTRPDAKLPVYVYIHGGGFVTGSGENLDKVVADTGVIGVSMNYRLGAAGFLSLPGLTRQQGESGNYGLMDQQLALTWVQRNISRFGGDPRRVTIGGESAGGLSVCYAMTAPGYRGTFSQAMIQSGACGSRTQAEAETTGTTVARSLGCTGAGAVACMRRVPVERLLTAPPAVTTAGVVRGTAFMPGDPWQRLTSGRFARVPTVVGSQLDEGRSFFQNTIGWNRDQYEGWVRATFGADADAVLARYPWPAASDANTAPYLLSDVATDSGVLASTPGPDGRIAQPGIGGCGTRELRAVISRYAPTYAYEFAHRTGPGWTDIPGYVWGAGHATELNYLFPQHGITTETEYHNFGPAEFALADQMVAYWGSFVKRGDPATRHQPPWPAYDPDRRGWTLSLRAGADGETRLQTDARFRADNRCDFWDSLARYQG